LVVNGAWCIYNQKTYSPNAISSLFNARITTMISLKCLTFNTNALLSASHTILPIENKNFFPFTWIPFEIL